MNNERFAVPEILFRPSDVGIQEMGITESLVHAVGTVTEGEITLEVRQNIVNFFLLLASSDYLC